MQNLTQQPQLPGTATRYILSEHEVVWSEIISRQPIDQVGVSKDWFGKNYHYFYGAEISPANRLRPYNYISKIDIKQYRMQRWYQPDCYPAQPIFVASPDRTSEDDGILLNLLYNQSEKTSILLLLDGKTMKEVARVILDTPLPYPLHGIFIPDNA